MKKMKRSQAKANCMKAAACLLMGSILAVSTSCQKKDGIVLDPKNPTTVTIWNYYNGDQLAAFDSLVSEFNSSVGVDEGVIVVSISQGNINTLADSLIDSVSQKAGSQNIPNLAAVYTDTAYILDQKDALADLGQYFTEDELSSFIPNFMEEGHLKEDGPLVLFPISKSTECIAFNATDWVPFSEATGINYADIHTLEDLTAAAKAYYDYTDALTPDVSEDGKSLYGRDSLSNYLYLGCAQLGHPMFTEVSGTNTEVSVDLDYDTLKTLWDNYYIPYINGYFGAYAKYRSEDLKTGSILCMTGSTSGVSYLPVEVTNADDTTHGIDLVFEKQLAFKDAKEALNVQQGADYCLLKSDEKEEYAASVFLKWFTESDRNLTFSLSSGYSPVTLNANTEDAIRNSLKDSSTNTKSKNILSALLISSDIFINTKAYTPYAFSSSKDIRTYLEDGFNAICAEDRAKVLEAIAGGSTKEEAVKTFCSEEYFNQWYTSISEHINASI